MTGLTQIVTQIGVSWGAVKTLAAFAALGIGLYWVWTLFVRTFRSDEDPSVRKTTSSRVGSSMILVSGAYYSVVLAAVIAFLTWPLALEQPLVGAALVFGVVYHSAIEYRESTE